jgi:GAF domain
MRTRTGRFLLLGLLLLVGAAAAVVTTYLAREIEDLDRASQTTSARVDRLLVAVETIGDALQAYIVPAGADRPTADRTPMLIADLVGEINEMARAVRSLRSGDILKALGDQARSLGEIEAKAQEHVRLGQDIMASEVIAAEARPALAMMTSSLVDLRAVETSTLETVRADSLRKAWSVVGGAAVVWALGLCLLAVTPRSRQSEAVEAATPDDSAILALSVPAPQPVANPVAESDLVGAADVCTAIGRLTNAHDLPPLLTQSAAVLGASGVVVWMAAGEELIAASAHGYDSHALNRLGPIHRAALNATAVAWRTGTMQVVESQEGTRGALVAPLLGTDRCIGVLAVEVEHGRERDRTTQAVTRVLAAQLAATLAPWPAASVADSEQPALEKAAEA